jgi:hypothetical protein
MAEPIYTTEAALETELGVDLPTATAVGLIQDAEDLIDRALGGWPPDETTGRKIAQGDVEAWQCARTAAATGIFSRCSA